MVDRVAVMVVEDEAVIRLLLADELEAAGFAVLQAGTADEAVLLFEAGPEVRAVITDVRMPGSMDGLGLAAWMRDNAAEVPLIVTSGFVSPAQAKSANPAIVAVFGKPYPPEDVVERVRQVVRQAP
ncbi:MAG: response regulator [Gemmatimonas sp.]